MVWIWCLVTFQVDHPDYDIQLWQYEKMACWLAYEQNYYDAHVDVRITLIPCSLCLGADAPLNS